MIGALIFSWALWGSEATTSSDLTDSRGWNLGLGLELLATRQFALSETYSKKRGD